MRIHSQDSLEKEIYRLQLELRRMEDQVDHNMDYLHEHGASLFMHSLFGRKKNPAAWGSGYQAGFARRALRIIFNKMADRIAGRAVNSLESLFHSLFGKGK